MNSSKLLRKRFKKKKEKERKRKKKLPSYSFSHGGRQPGGAGTSPHHPRFRLLVPSLAKPKCLLLCPRQKGRGKERRKTTASWRLWLFTWEGKTPKGLPPTGHHHKWCDTLGLASGMPGSFSYTCSSLSSGGRQGSRWLGMVVK